MPGSIRIATAPDFIRPKASAMKSMPGGTSNASRVPGMAPIAQSAGDSVAVLVELAKGDVPIAAAAVGVVIQRLDHGGRVRSGLGHCREPPGDVFCSVQHDLIMANVPQPCNRQR